MSETNFDLYYAACEADNAFQTELVRVYGAKACDKRYAPRHEDLRVISAQSLKHLADDAWLVEMRRVNT